MIRKQNGWGVGLQVEWFEAELHPKRPDLGKRSIPFSGHLPPPVSSHALILPTPHPLLRPLLSPLLLPIPCPPSAPAAPHLLLVADLWKVADGASSRCSRCGVYDAAGGIKPLGWVTQMGHGCMGWVTQMGGLDQ